MHTFLANTTSWPLLLILIPLLGGVTMLFLKKTTVRYILLLSIATAHFVVSLGILVFFLTPEHNTTHTVLCALGGIIQPDPLGTIFLVLASLLFLAASVYAIGYLKNEDAKAPMRHDFQDGTTFTNAPQQRFLACLCFFLASISLVTTTPHLGALWVGIECTTLSSAPLIYFHRHRRSLEATWKYLLICSVGIALALIGNILLNLAYYPLAESHSANQLQAFIDISSRALAEGHVPTAWLKAAFIFFLVGYGSKMGLAPLHNWLPDAHSEAPSLVSALLSGALLNCAFLGILRGHQILLSAGLGDFSGDMLIFLGLVSMGMAAIFIVGQGHFKRMLAYSSVEHMGILALGVGLGDSGVFASLLHAVNHSLTKAMLFLLAGNILHHYHTCSTYDTRGLRHTMPITAVLWCAGFIAIIGSPPFGLFVSEFSLLHTIITHNSYTHYIIALIYLTALGTIFVGMSVPVLRMVQGPPPPYVTSLNTISADTTPTGSKQLFAENIYNVGPSLVLGIIVLLLGMCIPHWLENFLRLAARSLGGV